MIDTVEARPGRAAHAASLLMLAYVCLSAIEWSPLPFNIQWCDVLFPVVLGTLLSLGGDGASENTTPAVAQQPPAIELLARAEGRSPLIAPHDSDW